MNNDIILTQHVSLPQTPRRGIFNGNILVVDPDHEQFKNSFLLPNILHNSSSFLVFDKDGALLSASRAQLERMGYEIHALALGTTDLGSDDGPTRIYYNPLSCVKTPDDAANLADILTTYNVMFNNLKVKKSLWFNPEKVLLTSCVSYVATECTESKRNFSTIVDLLLPQESNSPPPLDAALQALAREHPDHPAVQSYFNLKQAISPEDISSLCVTSALRLWPYGHGLFRKLSTANTIDLTSLGDRKVALFCIYDRESELTALYADILVTQTITALRAHATASYPSRSLPNHVRIFADTPLGQTSLVTRKFGSLLQNNISCVFYIPSVSRLDYELKRNRRSFIRSCHTWLYSLDVPPHLVSRLPSFLPSKHFRDIRHSDRPLDLSILSKPRTIGPLHRRSPSEPFPQGEYMVAFRRRRILRDNAYFTE